MKGKEEIGKADGPEMADEEHETFEAAGAGAAATYPLVFPTSIKRPWGW